MAPFSVDPQHTLQEQPVPSSQLHSARTAPLAHEHRIMSPEKLPVPRQPRTTAFPSRGPRIEIPQQHTAALLDPSENDIRHPRFLALQLLKRFGVSRFPRLQSSQGLLPLPLDVLALKLCFKAQNSGRAV